MTHEHVVSAHHRSIFVKEKKRKDGARVLRGGEKDVPRTRGGRGVWGVSVCRVGAP